MSKQIQNARKCLSDNNARGMSPSKQPIQWNLHNAISALISAFEEENQKLTARIAKLEDKER